MKSLRHRMTCVAVTGATVVAVPFFAPKYAAADPIEDQRQRVEHITNQLEDLERQADVLAEDYVVALDELRQLEADVSAAEEAVAEQQVAVAELQSELSEVAIQAFIGAGSNSLGAIFTDSTSFNAQLQRSELSRAALNTGTADSDDLDRELNELDEAQEVLEDQRDAAEQKKREVAEARQATDERTAEYEQARAEAEAELGQLIKEEEERRARESYERMQREIEAARQQAEAEAAAQAQQQQLTQNPQPVGGSSTSSSGNAGGSAGSSTGSAGGNSSSGGNTGGGGGSPAPAPALAAAPAAPAAAPAPAPAAIPPASSRAGTAVQAARSQLGVPYVFATSKPGVSFDCSGLTMYAWGVAGVSLPHQSRAQYASIPHVPSSAVQPGDLVFSYSPISHVSIYIGGGQAIHAPNSGSVVNITTVNWGNVTGVGRPG